MKKTAILISMFFLFLGCTQSSNMFLGVGQALDSEPPKISITSPENGIYINKSNITITGNCSDNVGVAKIRATAGINETASVVTEEVKFLSARESSWSVTFDENDLDRILNLWRSGLKVVFTFTCYDTAGNSVVEHLFLYVDVELPKVIINRPEVRFTDDEKNKYEKDVDSFKIDYDINKFEKVNSFINKEFIIKGYVDDDYSVKSTYINIYNATKKKQVAVTPIIFKDGTFIAGGNGEYGGVTGNSQSWEFTLDSTLFCPTEGWHVLEVVTEDEAGNEKRQFVTKDWLYINQAADIPKNNFTSFSPDFKLNAGNMIAGSGFDDDGMKEIWIKIVPKSEANPDTPYTEWKECKEADCIIKRCADFADGVQLGNWSLNVPSKANDYTIYAVPVDINGVAPQTPYEGIYVSHFSVASEEDPVVGIDSLFRGATIVEEENITGFFYDNEKVTKITAKMKFDDLEEIEEVLYDFSKSDDENSIKIHGNDATFPLITGQIVEKNFFTWNFKTNNYPAFKVLQITLIAKDEDNRYGEDAVTIYGDSERPVFVGEISPANNSDVLDTNVFEGTVSDNVEVVEVTIEASGSWGKKSWECTLGDARKDKNGKYEKTFKSDSIFPNDFGGYIDSEFTITAKDAAGNESSHIIFLKGDKSKPSVLFIDESGNIEKSGIYVAASKTLNIRIKPATFGDGSYREVTGVNYSANGSEIKKLTLGKYSSDGYYPVQLKISDLGEIAGDVTLQVTATDKENGDGQGTIYFIVDNEAPNGLSITSPMLKNKDYIEGLTDTAADIQENDISYYQNENMILKGTISDNYKISKTILEFYKIGESTAIYSVELTTDLTVSKNDEWIRNKSGIPGNFTLEIDTTMFDDGNYLLKTTAYDAAGNSMTWGDEENATLKDYYFKILQEADKPRFAFNFEFDSDGAAEVFPGTILKGSVVDDDAVAEKGVRYIASFKDELEDSVVKERFTKSDASVETIASIKSFTRQDWQIDTFKNVGTYYLYIQAMDIGTKESDIYKRIIYVTSTESPFIKSITSVAGDGGESNGYYSGKTKIIVNANGGESGLKNIVFRITSNSVVAKDETVIHNEVAESFNLLSVENSEDLGKWHKYTFKNTSESSKENVELLFDSTLFAEGKNETINVEVKCINVENATSVTVKDKIAIDNEGPTLKILTPNANVSVNKIFEISGSGNDRGAGLKDVYISYHEKASIDLATDLTTLKLTDITGNLITNLNDPEEDKLNKWYKLPEDKIDGISWSGEFDSEIIHAEAEEIGYTLVVAATDSLDNIGTVKHPIRINQDLDRPTVRLQNLSLSKSDIIWHKSGFIYGTISDDDGEVRSVQISEDGGVNWSENCYSNGSWSYEFSSDGEKKLAFKIEDGAGGVFTSADICGLTVPKVVDSAAINQTASKFTIKVDTESPEMTDVYFNAEPNTEPKFPESINTSAWSNSFSEKTFGGTEKKMWFLIGGTDENGIKAKGCILTATDQNSGVNIPDTNDTDRIKTALINGTSFYKYEIDISKVTLTSLNFKLVMEDESGLTTQKSFTVNVDNKAPTVEITSHSEGDNVYGTESNTIKGIVGEKDSTVEYALTGVKDGSVVEPNADDYIEIGNSSNWEIVFNKNTNNLNSKLKTLYNIPSNYLTFPKDTYDLYVWLKATDKYGNVSDKPTRVKLVVLANGDKPKVSIDYPVNPTAGEKPNVLGGRITIYGSTEIATSSVKEVYIQIDTNYNGTFASDWVDKLGNNAPSEDLKNKVVTAVGSIKGIPVTSSSKTNWRLNINEKKKMKGDIAVKAIAVSETGKYTESEIVVFTIDEDVPQFTDLKLVQYKDGVAVKTLGYEDDMWISGEGWKLECVVEDNSDVNPDTILKDEDEDVTDKTQLNDGRNGYKVKIPLSTNSTSGFGRLQFKLEAKDTSDPPAYNSQSFVLNYDNLSPVFSVKELSDASNDRTKRTKIENNSSGVYPIKGTFNEDSADGYNQSGFERIAMYFTRTLNDKSANKKTYVIDPMLKKGDDGESNRYDIDDKEENLISSDGMYWREATISTINDDKITLSSSVPNNVRKGGLVKVSGAIYRINDISGQQIVVAGTPDTGATKVYFAIAQVIDNTIQENGVTTYYDESNSINFDDDDKMVEGVSKVGTTYEWSVSINSENIFDGDVDVHFVAFDKAGNARSVSRYGKVTNNAPRIAGVSFGTDDNGNSKIEDNELIKNYANSYVAGAEGCELTVNTNGKLDTTPITNLKLPIENFDSASPLMTVKGNTSLNVKVVGGNTKLQWQWQIGSGNNWSEPITLTNSSSFNDDIREQSVIITTYDFVSYFDKNKITEDIDKTTLNIKIVDGTENGGQEAKIAIKVKTALLDSTPPTVTINPFYWNSESENSLYDNSRANGHIELEDDLPSDIFKEDTGIYDTDPKVSGKITISGTASDNVLLKALYVTISKFNDENDFLAIERKGTIWETAGDMTNDGWACEISDEEFSKTGHTLSWKLHWDTSMISGVVGKDINVQVKAVDRGLAKVNDDSISYPTSNSSAVKSYSMDVVPYITSIERSGGYSTKRTRSGAYPLLKEAEGGHNGNLLKGFNIYAGSVTLNVKKDKAGINDVESMRNQNVSKDRISFRVSSGGDVKDGYLHLTVDGIPALNNMNKRNAPYNTEPSVESEYWTDDRYVRIWEDTDRFGNDQTGTGNMSDVELAKNIVYPAMSMSDDGTLYASFTNYGMHAVYYTTVGGNSTHVFNANDAPEETTILVTGSGENAKVNVAFLANNQNGGNYANWTPYRSDAGGLYLHDEDLHDGDYTRMELLYHDKLFQQFKNFRLARGGNKIIHTAYYDVDTMSIHYSNINTEDERKLEDGETYRLADKSFEATWVNIDGGYDEHDIKGFDGGKYYRREEDDKGEEIQKERTICSDGSTNVCLGINDCLPASGSLSRSSATGEYVGIDVTKNNYPVIAYFDSANKIIRLACANNENPKSNHYNGGKNGEVAAKNWTIQRVITETSDANYTTANGNYINLQIDSKGYVHIVFVNGRGELVYVKSTNTYDDENTTYTFGKSVVIAENSPMNVSMTVRGETPYIGYLSSLGSYDGLNTAFWDKTLDLDNNGKTEGGWETMSAPLVHTVANNRACVEAHPDPSEWESAHAYYSVGYYRVAYYIGNGSGH